jgi:hypothetical protein
LSVRDTVHEIARLLAEAGEVGGTVSEKALAVVRAHMLQQAEMAAYQDTFLLLCAVTLLALLPAMLSRETPEVFGKPTNGGN